MLCETNQCDIQWKSCIFSFSCGILYAATLSAMTAKAQAQVTFNLAVGTGWNKENCDLPVCRTNITAHFVLSTRCISDEMTHFFPSTRCISDEMTHFALSTRCISDEMTYFALSTRCISDEMTHFVLSTQCISDEMTHFASYTSCTVKKSGNVTNITSLKDMKTGVVDKIEAVFLWFLSSGQNWGSNFSFALYSQFFVVILHYQIKT